MLICSICSVNVDSKYASGFFPHGSFLGKADFAIFPYLSNCFMLAKDLTVGNFEAMVKLLKKDQFLVFWVKTQSSIPPIYFIISKFKQKLVLESEHVVIYIFLISSI